ncbi:Prevent-host-death family protein [Cupriavidus taiwanensis]|uniref:type II toxin-antitoxin system Phd/YefM family antitoxin n=1 Tax=Cupriavidus taiwanensis TaxID=164546 RepID=UPI000E18DF24|nr:type II toxin-antitoxin system prevent-host-death family antitoxin [Cupriavidus taiwanensis]SPA30940.1 Prevent-host-death family protein [Cupriavidus taiwanensis]
MLTINMHDAKSQLSRLVDAVESGAESVVIIARNGKPAAQLVPVPSPQSQRIGGGRTLLGDAFDDLTLDRFNESDEEVGKLFLGERG